MNCASTRVPPRGGIRPRQTGSPTFLSITVSRRLCVPSLAPPAELLRALSGVLARLDVRWYVFGAQAVLHWGRPRFTQDIDVTVQLGSIETSHLVDELQKSGFVLRVEGTAAFIRQTRVVPLEFGTSGWALDVVLGGPGLEEEFQQRAVLVEVAPGLTVPIISAEDLVVTKVLAGRPKDLDDIRGVLLAQSDRLEAGRVRQVLLMLEDALGVSDLVRVFDDLAKS
jgi:hypothetical protein